MLVIVVLQWQRSKKRRAIEQERYLRLLQEHRYEESLASIEKNEAMLKELEEKLAEAENREVTRLKLPLKRLKMFNQLLYHVKRNL